jgi:hypothetical protein
MFYITRGISPVRVRGRGRGRQQVGRETADGLRDSEYRKCLPLDPLTMSKVVDTLPYAPRTLPMKVVSNLLKQPLDTVSRFLNEARAQGLVVATARGWSRVAKS